MKMRLRLKLGQQLALAFGSMVLLATTLAWVGWDQIKVIQYHFNGVVERTLPTLSALADLQERLQQLRVAELQHLTALTMPEKDREEIKVREVAKDFDAAVAAYLQVSAELGDATLIAQLKAKVAAFNNNRIRFFQMSNSAAGAEIERAQEAREYFNVESMQAFSGADVAARQLRAFHIRQADTAKAMGAAALASATRLLLAVGAATVVVSVLLAAFITRRVTRQLGGEPSHVAHIAKRIGDGDLNVSIPVKPPGDRSLMGVMGQMQAALRDMIDELRDTQARLVAAARMAGMAEIAANVLHNVGNVLNSVNVSANLVSTRLRNSKLKGLSRAVGLMDDHAHDLGTFLSTDAKGKLLPGYLRELAQTLDAEQQAMASELAELVKSVDHIKEIVATQQSYAGTPRIVESLDFAELVEDALRLNAGSLTRHKVDVVKDFGQLPKLMLDRHRLLQILVNLISNAKNAMDNVTDRVPRITLGARLVDGAPVDGEPVTSDPTAGPVGRQLRITVADNGEGVAPENLTRIFAHGFTTRQEGHGFGLHSCVLAAKEMGGSLNVHSEGPGRGACFILDLPIDVPESQ